MLEIQNKFVPESRAISPGMIWIKHQDEAYAETKNVGSKTIKLESIPTMILGTSIVEFTLMIDYGTVGFVPTQSPMEASKIPAQEEVTVVPEQAVGIENEETFWEEFPWYVHAFGFSVIFGIPIIIIVSVIILIKRRRRKKRLLSKN